MGLQSASERGISLLSGEREEGGLLIMVFPLNVSDFDLSNSSFSFISFFCCLLVLLALET